MRALAVILLAVSARIAAADAPWEEGVSPDNRAKANELFEQANTLFGQKAYGAALEKYQQAVAIWDHPVAHFNIAVDLIRLDRLLEAAEHLEAALRYGDQPYSTEDYQKAQDYQALIRGRVGAISVSCTQPNVQVVLDGKPWFACPATKTQKVLADEHQIVGEAKGLATESRRVHVKGGADVTVKLELHTFEQAYRYEYPSPRWMPWTVAGAGAALALGGLGFWVTARDQMNRFENSYTRECGSSCETDLSEHPSLREQRDSALFKNKVGIAMMVAGGAVTTGGVVWLVLNRPRRVPEVAVTPTAGGAEVMFSGRF